MSDFFLVLGGGNVALFGQHYGDFLKAAVRDIDEPQRQRYRFAALPQLNPQMRAFLTESRLDWALLPVRSFSSVKFLLSDMDSTLITIECIDELAALAGVKEQVAAITARSMRGELDFTASLRERVRLLRGLPVTAFAMVAEQKLRLSAGAEVLLAACAGAGIPFIIVSGGFTFFTDYLRRRYPVAAAYANKPVIKNGVFTGALAGPVIDAAAKAAVLHRYRQKFACGGEAVISVGDGANDIPMLQAAGFSFAFHAKAKASAAAKVAINYQGLDFIRTCFL